MYEAQYVIVIYTVLQIIWDYFTWHITLLNKITSYQWLNVALLLTSN
jgi:hypothetical protein